jgi:hypothetical protein
MPTISDALAQDIARTALDRDTALAQLQEAEATNGGNLAIREARRAASQAQQAFDQAVAAAKQA